MKVKKYLIVLILFLIFLISIFIKLQKVHSYEKYDFESGNVWFSTESALHYKYTKLIAEGKSLPKIDYSIQYPEGLELKHISLGMEYFYGYLYRFISLFRNILFHIFLIHAIAIFSSLSVVVVYLLAKEIWKNKISAIVASLFYSITLASFARFATFAFIREDFSLLFIFLNLLYFVKYLNSNNKKYIYYSGLSLFIALTTWHLTQFFFILLCGFGVLIYLFGKESLADKIKNYFSIITLFLIAAAILIPYLREKLFILSIPLIIPYAFTFVRLFQKTKYERILFFSFLVLITGIVMISTTNYPHVSQLIINKIILLGEKPIDSANIPYIARVYWTSGYDSPHLSLISDLFFILIPLNLFVFIFYLKKGIRKISLSQLFLIYFTLATGFLFLLMRRLHVFFIFFFVIWTGYFFSKRGKIKKTFVKGVYFIILVTVILQLIFAFNYKFKDPLIYVNQDLMDFLKYNTDNKAVIATSMPISQLINTYSNKNTIVQPFYETESIRDKYKELEFNLVKNEFEFYNYMRKYNVDYFVYYNGLSDMIYYDTATDIKENTAIFNFENNNVTYFVRIYKNDFYQVYGLINTSDHDYVKAIEYFNKNQTEKAISEMSIATKQKPNFINAYNYLGIFYSSKSDYDNAFFYWNKGLEINPNDKNINENIQKLTLNIN